MSTSETTPLTAIAKRGTDDMDTEYGGDDDNEGNTETDEEDPKTSISNSLYKRKADKAADTKKGPGDAVSIVTKQKETEAIVATTTATTDDPADSGKNKKEGEALQPLSVVGNGLVAPTPEEKEYIRRPRNCCKGCCPGKSKFDHPYHHTHCYRCCCLPCRLCLLENQITHCQRGYIIIVQALMLAFLITAILFATRVWHLKADGYNYLTVDYATVVQAVNVSINGTSRYYFAYITPFAVEVRSSDDDPPCKLAPSGNAIVLRLSFDSNGTHVYVQTDAADGVKLTGSAPKQWAWVSNATASGSSTLPSGADVEASLAPDELVKLI